MIVSSHPRGSTGWWVDRITYRMDGLGYPVFIIAIIVAALIGFQDGGFLTALWYGAIAFAVVEVIMQVGERI